MFRRLIAIIGFSFAIFAPINASGDFFEVSENQFSSDATVVDFETGSTGLPVVPGLSFLSEGATNSADWFASSGNFEGFFGQQGWSNLVSGDYSNIGVEFDASVQAFGGWFGQIPNFTGEHPPQIEVRVFDPNSELLGTSIIDLNVGFNDPVWIGFGSNQLISRAEFRVNQFPDDGFFSGDNFTFGSVVPEPSLTAFGIILVVSIPGRRCRR